MRKILSVILILAIVLTGCSNFTTIGNKVYQNCVGNLTACTSGDLYVTTATNKTVVYSPVVYNDVSILLAQARTPASLAPTWTPYQGTQVPAFSASQVNVIYFSAQLPHNYKEGEDIEFHIHVAYPDNVAGNSTWYFTYSWANLGDTFPVHTGVYALATSPEIADEHQYIEMIANIDGTGKEISSVILCSIQRIGTDVNDNYPNVIYGVSADFHVPFDTVGSRTRLSK